MEYPAEGMFLLTQENVNRYLSSDTVQNRLASITRTGEEQWICQQWLLKSAPKRYLFESLYGDLFQGDTDYRVLDVGGGLTSFTRELVQRHQYELVDLLAHDHFSRAKELENEIGKTFIFAEDWIHHSPHQYDIVIANDLFPNVDQRLEIFLTRFLPVTKRLRVSLTYYDTPRYYLTRRVDAEEVLCMLAWDGRQCRSVLERFFEKIVKPDLDLFSEPNVSVYPNGRQVCVLEFRGGL